MNILITGGGTGGHLSVVKALKQEIFDLGHTPFYIGSTNGQDISWFKDDKEFKQKYFLNTKGVVNQNLFGKIISLYKILIATISSIKIIKSNNIDITISVGGFSAAPASFATIILRNRLYIHEQNSVLGKLNSLLSKYCVKIFSSYNIGEKIDYPINNIHFENQRVREKIKTIIILGGSQGAKKINDFALLIAPILKANNIKIIHQSGAKDFKRVEKEYKELNIDVDLFDFSSKLYLKIKKADFAISRSGASTLWELVANGIPTLFIPYPYASSNHQYHNAKFLKDSGLCYLIEESKLNKSIISNLVNLDLKTISKSLMLQIKPDGTKKIVQYLVK